MCVSFVFLVSIVVFHVAHGAAAVMQDKFRRVWTIKYCQSMYIPDRQLLLLLEILNESLSLHQSTFKVLITVACEMKTFENFSVATKS